MLITCRPALLFMLLTVGLVGISGAKKDNAQSNQGSENVAGPEYTADGQLKLPEHYREWVWLTSDFYKVTDPSKTPAAVHIHFNNMFVNPEAYKAFLLTGTWPDKTMLVVEQREAGDLGSTNPNLQGWVQDSESGLAMHVKDEERFPGQWAFFAFKGATTASAMPTTAGCYSCHAAHGAADTTFVQYYPTLLPIAKKMNTLSTSYVPLDQSLPPHKK